MIISVFLNLGSIVSRSSSLHLNDELIKDKNGAPRSRRINALVRNPLN